MITVGCGDTGQGQGSWNGGAAAFKPVRVGCQALEPSRIESKDVGGVRPTVMPLLPMIQALVGLALTPLIWVIGNKS